MIDIFLKTKSLHTYNGWEFRNKVMESYLKENNIDHITGGPYNSQHQGVVEGFNKTIQDSLISAKDNKGIFLDSINDFLV